MNISQFASRIDGTLLMLTTDQGVEKQRVVRTFVPKTEDCVYLYFALPFISSPAINYIRLPRNAPFLGFLGGTEVLTVAIDGCSTANATVEVVRG